MVVVEDEVCWVVVVVEDEGCWVVVVVEVVDAVLVQCVRINQLHVLDFKNYPYSIVIHSNAL